MLAAKFTTETPIPFPGSQGYLKGEEAEHVRVLTKDRDGTCLVQLLDRGAGPGQPGGGLAYGTVSLDRRASGNRRVPSGDIYETAELARHFGKPPKSAANAKRAAGRGKAR